MFTNALAEKRAPIAKDQGNTGGSMQSSSNVMPLREPIVDTSGNPVTAKQPTLMARLEAKASEKVELSRGTIWLLATALVLAGVVFSYGSSLLTWTREDQATRERTMQTQKDVEAISKQLDAMQAQFNELQKALMEQRIKEAEKRGYELKAAEGDHK